MPSEGRRPDASSCEFCKIVRGDEAARVIGETDETLAFFPLEPATAGHTLIIPKAHVPDVWALDAPLGAKIAVAVLRMSHAIRNALSPEGLNIINSNGEAATQTVFHFHVHLVPRWSGDHIGNIWPPAKRWPDEVEDELAGRVRRSWDGLVS